MNDEKSSTIFHRIQKLPIITGNVCIFSMISCFIMGVYLISTGQLIFCFFSVFFIFLPCTALLFYLTQNILRPVAAIARTFIEEDVTGAPAETELLFHVLQNSGDVGNLILALQNILHNESKTQILNTEVELYALQSEINPHFLYNALDAIRNYAMADNCIEISDMTLALAKIFRYSISRPGEVATLADELNNVENYLKIQQYRFPQRFSLELDIDSSDSCIMRCTMPVLTLQPIVENAFSHGLEDRSTGGIIRISATTSQNNLVITITDNGNGMTPETLENLRAKLTEYFVPGIYTSERHLNRKSGISLNNVNHRLKLYFGNEYGLNVTSCLGKFTSVEIVVPKITS